MAQRDEEMGFLGDDAGLSVGSASVAGTMDAGPAPAARAAPVAAGAPAGQGGTDAARAGQSGVVDMFRESSHPLAAFFHVAFKIAALTLYVFGSWFSDSFVVLFVLCIVLLAFDFWTVKNITGRLMVGLRWWNDEVGEDGSNHWRFESIENVDQVSPADYRIFWYSQYINVVLWVLLGFLDLLKLHIDWLLLVLVAISLGCSNVYGYWQCSKDARKRLEGAVQGAVQQHALSFLTGSLSSTFSRAVSGGGAGAASSGQVSQA